MIDVDIAVIGAGIAGLSVAWELAADHRVAILEQESSVAHHATGRSAAILSETSGLFEVCGLAAASRAFFVDPPDGFTDHALTHQRGLLWVSNRASDLDAISEVAGRLDLEFNDGTGTDAAALVPVLRPEWVARSVHEPGALGLDVAGLVNGYRQGVLDRKGSLFMSSAALQIRRARGSWLIDGAGSQQVRCQSIVNSAGAWADVVAGRAGLAPLGIQPFRRSAFIFPVEEAGVRSWPLVMDAGNRFYFEPEANGLLASPSEETPVDPHDARADELAMAKAVDALTEATTLRVRGVRHRWAGLRSFVPDRLPVVGEDPRLPGFFWLAGQGGAGIKTAPAMARLLASIINEQRPPVDIGFDPDVLGPERLLP